MPRASAARRGLTGRSKGRATARQPARAAHRPIMRRTGGLPCCRAPLNSALGLALKPDRADLHRSQEQARSYAKSRSGTASTQTLRGRRLSEVVAPQSCRARALARRRNPAPARPSCSPVVVGASRQRAAPRSQFVVALPSEGLCLRSAPCRQRRSSPPLQLNCCAICQRRAARPNRSFKGTRNSKAARPCGAQAYHAPHGRAPLLSRAP